MRQLWQIITQVKFKKKQNLKTEIAIHAGVDAKTCFLKMENLIKIVCVLLFLVLFFFLDTIQNDKNIRRHEIKALKKVGEFKNK